MADLQRILHLNKVIRLGDPFFQHLFILCAGVFSHLLGSAEESNSLRGIKLAPPVLSINHLLFVDDCIIFSRASLQDLDAVSHALCLYEHSSGQKVNFDKTTIFFS